MGQCPGQALEQSKKGCHKVEFDNNKRIGQTEFIPGSDESFDMLVAKVRAAVDKGRASGEQAVVIYEEQFHVKLG